MTALARALGRVSSMSFRAKIASALVAVLCLAIASLGLAAFSQQKRLLREEMQKRAEVIVAQIASAGKAGLLTKDDLVVYGVIRDVQRTSGVAYAFVLDSRGKVFARSAQTTVSDPLSGPAAQAAREAKGLLFQQTTYEDEPVIEAALPIVSKLGKSEIRVGTARVGISLVGLEEAVRRQKLVYLALAGAFVAVGLLISFALGNLLSRQLVILTEAMRAVAAGDLNRTAEVRSRDDIGRLTETFNEMVLNLREKLHMEKYLSASTMEQVKKMRDERRLELGGERRYVAALFSDIRGFTSMTETLAAEEVVGLINLYLNLQAEIVSQRRGAVDKFVGDEVMAIFTGPDCEAAAARAAVEIQECVASLNAIREAEGAATVRLGVGLNAGEVIMGNMGSERQMDYTVIGDAVNVAARLCGAAGPGQIVMTDAFLEALGERCRAEALPDLKAKGKKEPLKVHALLAMDSAGRRHRRKTLDQPVEFKRPGAPEPAAPARLRELGVGGCVLETSSPVERDGVLDLSLDLAAEGRLTVSGAVIRHVRRSGDAYLAGLTFPALPDRDRAAVSRFVHRVGGASRRA